MVNLLGLVLLALFIVIVILPTFLLSRLLKIEHDDFHDQWEKDGRPVLMPFWFPFEKSKLFGFRSYPWFMGALWLFKKPNWVNGHIAASKLLKYYRLVSYFVYLGLFSACLLFVFSALS